MVDIVNVDTSPQVIGDNRDQVEGGGGEQWNQQDQLYVASMAKAYNASLMEIMKTAAWSSAATQAILSQPVC